MRHLNQVVVDWDGTAVPEAYPNRPTSFMPGFVHAMQRLHAAGLSIVIDSARLNTLDPITYQPRDPAHRAAEIAYVRDMLDRAGLTYVDIWTKHGKPGGIAYVDNHAERYTGRPGSWDKVTTKILTRLNREETALVR